MQFDHQKGRYIPCGDAQIYVEEIENAGAPVLVLLHGGFGDVTSFNGITPMLGRHFHLIGMDSRGHGKSTLGGGALSYQLLADDVANVVGALGLTRFSILGLSDGGITAYRYALKGDARLDKLVTVGSGWELSKSDPEWEIYAGMTPDAWRDMFPDSYETYMALNPEASWERFAASVIAMWTNLGPDNYPGDKVAQIENQILVVRGDKDPLTSLTSMARLSARLPNMDYFNVPFAEHVAFDDQPELFLSVVNLFFQKS